MNLSATFHTVIHVNQYRIEWPTLSTTLYWALASVPQNYHFPKDRSSLRKVRRLQNSSRQATFKHCLLMACGGAPDSIRPASYLRRCQPKPNPASCSCCYHGCLKIRQRDSEGLFFSSTVTFSRTRPAD